MNIEVCKNTADLATKAAGRVIEKARYSIKEHDRFSIALAGGTTPKGLYSQLAQSDEEWKKWTFFFGDERDVSPDDEQSNLRMAKESLFRSIPPEERSIVAWGAGSSDRLAVAENYADRIRAYFGFDSLAVPRFDLILLGMGTDGHTASLFPDTAALKESDKIAVANFVPKLNEWRYTLTFPVINNARNVIFLVSGSDKAATLREVISGTDMPDKLPAQRVEPHRGELEWFIDEAAGTLLTL